MVELELSEWLKGDDIKDDDILVFLDDGERKKIPQAGDTPEKDSFEITVELPDGKKKTWTMNMTSQRAVAGVYGKDTAKWVGRTVTVFKSEQNVQGTMRKVIYARIPEVEPKPIEETVV